LVKFHALELEGAYLVEPEPFQDKRGFFARMLCRCALAEHGLESDFVTVSLSYNKRRHTVRGMHFQHDPYAQVKVVTCTSGALYDVIVDLRPGSSTYLRWYGVELSHSNRRMLYVPKGFAHGYQTLTPNAEALYLFSSEYVPESEGGLRWDDPAVGIEWPQAATRIISEKDIKWPLLEEAR
jgi:dTDP-4-dehydrorhamnose 3,5-epimerase